MTIWSQWKPLVGPLRPMIFGPSVILRVNIQSFIQLMVRSILCSLNLSGWRWRILYTFGGICNTGTGSWVNIRVIDNAPLNFDINWTTYKQYDINWTTYKHFDINRTTYKQYDINWTTYKHSVINWTTYKRSDINCNWTTYKHSDNNWTTHKHSNINWTTYKH